MDRPPGCLCTQIAPRLTEDGRCVACEQVRWELDHREPDPWHRNLSHRTLVSLCAMAILDHWDTPPDEARLVVRRLLEHATGGTEAGPQTEVSAAKALMDMAAKRAAMEQAERFKAKEGSGAPEDGVEDIMRRALDEAGDD